MTKEKVQKDKQRSTKHTHKTKDRVTRTPIKTGDYCTFSASMLKFHLFLNFGKKGHVPPWYLLLRRGVLYRRGYWTSLFTTVNVIWSLVIYDASSNPGFRATCTIFVDIVILGNFFYCELFYILHHSPSSYIRLKIHVDSPNWLSIKDTKCTSKLKYEYEIKNFGANCESSTKNTAENLNRQSDVI